MSSNIFIILMTLTSLYYVKKLSEWQFIRRITYLNGVDLSCLIKQYFILQNYYICQTSDPIN